MELMHINSPIGALAVESEGNSVRRISRSKSQKISPPKTTFQKQVKRNLEDWLKGKTKKLRFKVEQEGTPFQKKVWSELRKIPYGKVVSYKEIAKKIGHPGASRAVGSACGKNALLLAVPCHRVVATNKGLGGFALGLKSKKALLKIEGAQL